MNRFRFALSLGAALVLLSHSLVMAQAISPGETKAVSANSPTEAAAAATPPDYGELIAAKKVPSIYPFQVKVGGQLAAIEGNPQNAIFAKLKEPVSPDAEIEILGVPGMIIINVFKVNPDGSVTSSASPKIIMVQNGTKTRLDATLDKSTLPPGLYGMNIVYANVTSRVMFTVK
jgi:hypothetical protein